MIRKEAHTLKAFVYALVAAISMGCAWLMPSTIPCAVLGWVSATALARLFLASEGAYLPAYICGLIMTPIGFYWLPKTISYFGGFGVVPTVLIFFLYVTVSSIQFLIAAFIFRNLPRGMDRLALRLPTAWTLSELVSVRIFPWQYGHTQMAFLPFIQAADLLGSLFITFLMIWIAEGLVRSVAAKAPKRLLLPATILTAVLFYGVIRIGEFDGLTSPKVSVAIVQANVSIEEKHDAHMVSANLQRYVDLTSGVSADLVVWPETVLTEWVSVGIRNRAESRYLLALPSGSPLLLGTLAFEQSEHGDPKTYNAAVGIDQNGPIAGIYKKQVLMPFGEYVPLASWFPFLREAAGIPKDFTAGASFEILDFQSGIRAAPLICYEDVIPGIAMKAAGAGANLLVNLTNDGWFGNTAAPLQHHMIASMRAVEDRRYLVRSTNTGLTAVLDPVGRTTSRLAPYSEGTLKSEVVLIERPSIYSKYSMSRFWWILLMVCVLSIGYKMLKSLNRRSKT